MRKFLISIISIFIGFSAYCAGENIPTSKSYVDSILVPKQDIIEGTNDAPRVLTNTGTAGEYGTKDIYDSTDTYSGQMDALIDAQTMNTAVQNAIDSEFQCVEYNPNDPTDCWLMDVRGAPPPQSILPTGYTALEYVVADTNQCIITNVPWGAVYGFRGRAQQKVADHLNKAVFGSSGTGYTKFYGTMYNGTTQEKYWYWAQSESYLDIGEFNFTRVGETDTWAGTVNNVNSSNGNIDVTQNDNVRLLCSGNKSRWFDGNVWYLQLFDKNRGFLLNAIPAKRDSDGVVGFYDLVSGQMLTNSGTSEFTAGPVANLYLPSGN